MDKQKFDSFFADLNLTQLTDRDREFLEAPIKIEEISQAIRSMPPNKSLDGLPAEFYRTFEDIISPMLLEVYSDAFKAGTFYAYCSYIFHSQTGEG